MTLLWDDPSPWKAIQRQEIRKNIVDSIKIMDMIQKNAMILKNQIEVLIY